MDIEFEMYRPERSFSLSRARVRLETLVYYFFLSHPFDKI